ncbi:MAG: hypothetical protein FJ279_28625, partial [Planctomycetes bacterium]|nr:hypothetical protein [Planctomycetota bacterium]
MTLSTAKAFFIVLALCASCAAEMAAIGSGPLKVGLATADITPQGTVWMAGFAARKKPSEGIHKQLTGSCVVFDNGVTRLAFVAFDLCKIYEKQLGELRAAAEKAGIPPQHVMINCSHTHSGPELSEKRNAD